MNHALAKHIGVCCLVYLDDILIFSTTPEQDVQHLRLILHPLRDAQLYCKLSKCNFAVDSLQFLGRDGVRPAPAKVEVLVSWPEPTNAHELRCFLGLSQYLAKYIPGYAVMKMCLQILLENNAV